MAVSTLTTNAANFEIEVDEAMLMAAYLSRHGGIWPVDRLARTASLDPCATTSSSSANDGHISQPSGNSSVKNKIKILKTVSLPVGVPSCAAATSSEARRERRLGEEEGSNAAAPRETYSNGLAEAILGNNVGGISSRIIPSPRDAGGDCIRNRSGSRSSGLQRVRGAVMTSRQDARQPVVVSGSPAVRVTSFQVRQTADCHVQRAREDAEGMSSPLSFPPACGGPMSTIREGIREGIPSLPQQLRQHLCSSPTSTHSASSSEQTQGCAGQQQHRPQQQQRRSALSMLLEAA